MEILVADSGSTKTNWLGSGRNLIRTAGLNPLFHTSQSILEVLEGNEELQALRKMTRQIYFYGASCSSPERNSLVESSLRTFFTAAEVVKVDHDLKAAALACWTGKPGIACILGTGSNSCFYDGSELSEQVPALGYVLGDEGSGAWLGKKLVTLYLYKQLPADLQYRMKHDYGAEKETLFDRIYRRPHPNVYLASFARVLSETTEREFADELVGTGFREFFDAHVCCYPGFRDYPVHVVGSIGYHFKSVLESVCSEYRCQLGLVEQNPVFRLLERHEQGD